MKNNFFIAAVISTLMFAVSCTKMELVERKVILRNNTDKNITLNGATCEGIFILKPGEEHIGRIVSHTRDVAYTCGEELDDRKKGKPMYILVDAPADSKDIANPGNWDQEGNNCVFTFDQDSRLVSTSQK